MRHDNIFKFIELIRVFFDILVITITFLCIFNIGWVFLAKDIYWPLYSKLANVLGVILIFSFFIFGPILIWSHFKPLIRIVTSVILGITLYFELATTEVSSYIDSIIVKDKTVILARYSLDNGSSCYQVLKCETDSTYCKEAQPQLDYCAIGNPGPESMLIDETDNLNIYIDGILAYTYKDNLYMYKIEDLVFHKEYIYWVVHTKTSEDILFIFGRCDEQVKDSCEILQQHINPSFQHIDLEINETKDELLIFYDGVLGQIE